MLKPDDKSESVSEWTPFSSYKNAQDAEPDYRTLDPALTVDINRQRQEVAALEQYMLKLPPEAQMLVMQDLQAARNSLSMGQLVDASTITRISMTVNDQEMKQMTQAVVGGAAAVGGIATLVGSASDGIDSFISNKNDKFFKISETNILEGSVLASVGRGQIGLGDLLGSFSYPGLKAEDIRQGVSYDMANLGTNMQHGLPATAQNRALEVQQGYAIS